MPDLDRSLDVTQVSGVEGPSLYIDGLRVAGNKPWGGGSYLGQWRTTPRAVLVALGGAATRSALANLDPSEAVVVTITDGEVSIAGRALLTTPGERSYPRNALWHARRVDIIESLAESVRHAPLAITADINHEVVLWHQQRRVAKWALALELLLSSGEA